MTASGPYRGHTFAGWLTAYGISLLGDEVFALAFAYAAARLGNAALTGVVTAAGAVPRALLLVVGGAFADRVGLRRLMLTADLARTALMLVAALVAGLGGVTVALLVVVSVLFGVADAVYLPAASALPALLLPADRLPAVAGARQAVNRAAMLAGAPLAAIVVASGGFTVACLVNAVSFAVSVALLWRLRPRRPMPLAPRAGLLSASIDGLRYVARHPGLRWLIGLLTVVEFCLTGAFNVGVPLRVVHNGWGATGLAWLTGAFGAGAVAGALLVSRWRPHRHPGLLLTVPSLLTGAALIVLGTASVLPLAITASGITGLCAGVVSTTYGWLVQATTDLAYQARVGAVTTLQSTGLSPIAYAGFGALAAATNLTATFIACAVAAILASAVGLAAPLPTLTTARTTPQPASSPTTEP